MSHTHEPSKAVIPNITRNGITLACVEDAFGKQSNTPGRKFFKVELDLAKSEHQTWFGLDNLTSMTNRYIRKEFAAIHNDNVDEKSGEFNFDQWLADATDFTAGVAKLSELEEQLDSLQVLQQNYALDANFGATDDNGEKTPEAVELENKIREVAKRIKPLRTQKAAIEAKYAAAAAKRKAKEAASATKTAAPAEGQTEAPVNH